MFNLNRGKKEEYNYRPKMYEFSYVTKDDELIHKFEDTWATIGKELFTDWQTFGSNIKVTDNDARSVANGGTYHKKLTEFANTVDMTASNNSDYKDIHQQKAFSVILKNTTTFQGLMSKIDEYMKTLKKTSYEWNVLYYGYYKEQTLGG